MARVFSPSRTLSSLEPAAKLAKQLTNLMDDFPVKRHADKENAKNHQEENSSLTTTAVESTDKELRQGRRAGAAYNNNNNELDDDLLEGDLGQPAAASVPPDDMPPRPSRRQGGWADDTPKEKRRVARGDGIEAFDDDERLRVDNEASKEEDNDILVIPDLEEVQEEDMATQIAAPPSIQVNRVATYKELDSYYQKHSALFTLDGDIDLKLLSSVLSPEAEVFEEDNPWDWNRLFTEVASELQTEWDKAGEKETETTEKT